MSNAYDVVRTFESEVAKYTGAPYAVAVESCSAALFLCFVYSNVKHAHPIIVPSVTYPSVPCSIINAGGIVRFENIDWQWRGFYVMDVLEVCYEKNNGPTFEVVDSAKYLAKNMWNSFDGYCRDKRLVCLSFHGKKHLKIGRGGMVLTDSKEAAETFRWMRFDGRHEMALDKDTLAGIGYNCYLSPEQAARGLEQLQWIGDGGVLPPDPYQDLSKYKFYQEANR